MGYEEKVRWSPTVADRQAGASPASPVRSRPESLHVDCDGCAVRGLACGDCVITVLLGAPPDGVELGTEVQDAIAALSGSGLVPPLRLVPGARPVRSEQPPVGWVEPA